ncbi:hypothetical protein Ahy_A07g034472 [Arachis hypogaea]|uniref:MULE transposase domain-containing protein n=1 Tax=Arachis hypogaea TaxID=3818 RepID=A0A445CBW7_ARAHY|nr:hypothetical protein Ahy_A07g034472 [Arachis hypogaea]
MGFFDHMCSGYRNLNFVSKDLYNYIDVVWQSKIVEGDTATTISYLKGKTESNPTAVVQDLYCIEKHIGHLFRSNGYTQCDYECFGDVLAFDSIFGFLEDEKIPSYKWLLSSFFEEIRHKESKVVATDGDESMREAIRSEFPNNFVVNIKDNDFCTEFKIAMCGHFDVEDFDDYWVEMVASFDLEDNDGLPRHIKRDKFIKSGNCLLDLVENLDRIIRHYTRFGDDYGSPNLGKIVGEITAIYCVLKELEKEELASCLVLRRWCKYAKVSFSGNHDVVSNHKEGFHVRYSLLWRACLSMFFLVAQATETYDNVITKVSRMSRDFKSVYAKGQRGLYIQAMPTQSQILDSKVGVPRGSTNTNNRRCCRRCLGVGHD